MLDSGMSEQDMVNQEFEELYPGKIERTQIAYNAKVCISSLPVSACPLKPTLLSDRCSAVSRSEVTTHWQLVLSLSDSNPGFSCVAVWVCPFPLEASYHLV